MNSIDLKLIISSDYKLSKTFRGVFAYNKLPSIVSSFPSSYIVNTDIAKKKGEHWIALYFESPELCEIFDSYGLQPFGQIYTFASNNAGCVLYNKMFLQSPFSRVCGLYCIYFLYHKSRGYPLRNILSASFEDYSWERNDAFVKDGVNFLIS